MAGRPTLAWRREHPYERLVMAYTDAYTNLGIAYSERPPFGATTDSEEVRQFLEKLTEKEWEEAPARAADVDGQAG
jgi:hypothetical protein